MAKIEQLPLMPSTITEGALAELEHLRWLVERLSPSDWSRPSAVEGWTIGQVVAHLDLFLAVYSRLLGTALSADASGGVAKTVGWLTESVVPSIGPIFHTVNGTLPTVMDRMLAPEVVTRQCTAGLRRTREFLLAAGRDDDARPVHEAPSSYPRSFYLAITVSELAIHGWDIESMIEDRADLSTDARRILPWFYWSGTRLMLHVLNGTTGTIQALLSEPEAAMWWTITDRSIGVGQGTTPAPDATIRGPSGPYILALAGRLTVAEVLGSSLAVEGDSNLVKRFLGSWRLI